MYLYERNTIKKEAGLTETFTVPYRTLLIQRDTRVPTFLTHPWCFLYDLLVSPLDAAVSLEQIHSVTVHVPEHLNLHMSAGDRQMQVNLLMLTEGNMSAVYQVADKQYE